jgi:hypothetical protein
LNALLYYYTFLQVANSATSFETNRILKNLAVITEPGDNPLLDRPYPPGMNLLDMPYTFELWQITVVTVFSIAFVGYCFVKLGWLA